MAQCVASHKACAADSYIPMRMLTPMQDWKLLSHSDVDEGCKTLDRASNAGCMHTSLKAALHGTWQMHACGVMTYYYWLMYGSVMPLATAHWCHSWCGALQLVLHAAANLQHDMVQHAWQLLQQLLLALTQGWYGEWP